MAHVERQPGEGLESLLKRFRRKLQDSGQLRAYRRNRYFVSKSEAKRDKARKAQRRLWQRQRRLQQRELRRRRGR